MALLSGELTDEKGRLVRPVLFNTAKDGSGTWLFALLDADGHLQVDSLSALPVGTNVIGKVGHDITGIGHGVKTVTTAGTDVPLVASPTPAKGVIVQAQSDNTDKVAVGATGVDATEATGTGILMEPGDAVSLLCDDLADIYIDALVNGEGVRFSYFT